MFDTYFTVIMDSIDKYFTEFGLHDIVLTPYYLYMATLEWALHLYSVMREYPITSAFIVFFIVLIRTVLQEGYSAKNGTLTFVNIENPKRKYFNIVRMIFWMILAPLYPLYFWATKGTMYLIIAYLMPYFCLRRLFDKYYFLREPQRLSTSKRYEKLNS
jgi:hypothetical protein